MILIADSGSTKTDWRLIDHHQKIHQYRTIGFNPFFVSTFDIIEELEKTLLRELKDTIPLFKREDIKEIYFYGAGCSSPSLCRIVEKAFIELFPDAKAEVEHDLLGAARALCGRDEGIATILGTGSNSCYYNGKEIVKNIPGIGYVLGDEGSGAYMGKKLVVAYMYDELPLDLHKRFVKRFNLTKEDIMEEVYKKPHPNRFLASFSKFIYQNLKEDFVRNIVVESFGDFFRRSIVKYEKHKEVPMGCVGAVAFFYSDILKSVAEDFGVKIGKILEAPAAALVIYHMEGKG